MLKQQTRFPIWQSLAVSLAGSMLMLADDEFNHSRVRHLVQQHFWLIIFLPMVLFVLFMFVRFYYLEYKN
jgi:hypothetical protein